MCLTLLRHALRLAPKAPGHFCALKQLCLLVYEYLYRIKYCEIKYRVYCKPLKKKAFKPLYLNIVVVENLAVFVLACQVLKLVDKL